jgi:hypothetical protein
MSNMESPAIPYTPAMLARLAHADDACELSEKLASEVGTCSDRFGRGAFLTEQAAAVLVDARAFLQAAVIADRLRGAPWASIAEALDSSLESARQRFAPSEHDFRDAILFPYRYCENGDFGSTVAPYAVEEPDHVRQRLDAWAVEHRRGSGPDREEPQPVTRGLTAMSATWIVEQMSQVLALTDALIKRSLPAGVSYEQARRRHAEMKVELYEAMVTQRPGQPDVELQLNEAREQLSEFTA